MSDTTQIASPHPPRIGRWRIDGLLGCGANGMVYRGYDEMIERPVAIKTIHQHLLLSENREEFLARFRQEVRAAGRCTHRNIVTIHDFGESEGTPYIVMEFVNGRNLRAVLKGRGPQPLELTVSVISQVLRALAVAHQAGVVHRDVKPGNIILQPDGQVKVTDFGIARLPAIADRTATGIMLGTPGYMPPEQLRGLKVDARADLFAVGVIFFEMLTGTRAFPVGDSTQWMARTNAEIPPLASSLNPAVPKAFDAIVAKGMAKSPEQRFQTAHEFLAALEHAEGRDLSDPALSAVSNPTQSAFPPPSPVFTERQPDAEMLLRITDLSVTYLGPMARVIVRRAAAKSRSVSEMSETLAALIPQETERLRYRRQVRAASGETLLGTRSVPTQTTSTDSQINESLGLFSQAFLEKTRQRLADYLGPIAKILVKKSAADARTADELFRRLAKHIPTSTDQAAFLRQAEAIDRSASRQGRVIALSES